MRETIYNSILCYQTLYAEVSNIKHMSHTHTHTVFFTVAIDTKKKHRCREHELIGMCASDRWKARGVKWKYNNLIFLRYLSIIHILENESPTVPVY